MSRIRRLALGLLALLAAAAPAAAQTVRGTVADADGSAPVSGALVVLLDASGRTRAEVLTDQGGRFLLRAPAPGRYTLRADRIGHVSTRSAPLELTAGATQEVRLAAPTEPVRLEAVAVSAAGRRCTVRPEGAESAVLWDEANKALRSSAATRQQYPYRFRVTRAFRELDPHTEAVQREEARSSEGFTTTPFASLSVEELARRGYVETDGDTIVFYAPDAAVLLSEAFLDTHCFRVQPADREHAGMIGLAFEPVRGVRTTDVHGVLWLDAASAELRLLEYGYRNLPRGIPAEQAGGRVSFQRLPNGAWIVPQWRIRMPQQTRAVLPGVPGMGGPRIVLAEEVGEVVEIRTASGARVPTVAHAAVSGVVYDSTRAAPLAGAVVRLAGTEHAAAADSAGRYRIEGVSEGVYSLAFSHPRLDTVGYSPAPVRVRLVPPRELAQDLALPSLAVVRTASCPSRPEGTAALAGVVRGGGGEPLPGALVTALWQAPGESGDSTRLLAVADEDGVYRLCSVPAGLTLRLQARLGGDTATAAYRVEGAGPGAMDLVLAASAPAGPALAAGVSPRVAGRLLDAETGRPIQGATVRFTRGLPEQVTDRRGTFTLADVPAGTYGLEFQHERYGAGTSQMSVPGGSPVQFDLRVPRRTVTLEAVAVVAERVRPSDFVRSRRRQANFMDRSTIERRPAARHVGDLVRTFPRLSVREIYYPNSQTLIREVCIEDRTAAGLGDPSVCRNIGVVLDDVPMTMQVGELIRDLPVSHVESVEFVSASDAAFSFPFSTEGGVLVIYTRGFRPTLVR